MPQSANSGSNVSRVLQIPEEAWAAALHATLDRAGILRRLMGRHSPQAGIECAVVSLVPQGRLGTAFRAHNRRVFRCVKRLIMLQ